MTNMLFKIDDGLFFPWWAGPVTFFFFLDFSSKFLSGLFFFFFRLKVEQMIFFFLSEGVKAGAGLGG